MKCASCGSPDLEFFPGNFGRCRACGTTFAESPQGAMPPPAAMQHYPYVPSMPPPAPAAGGGGKFVVLVVIAVLILAVAGAVVPLLWVSMAGPGVDRSSRPRGAGPDEEVQVRTGLDDRSSTTVGGGSVEVAAPKELVAKAEFRDQGSAAFSRGRMWIGRYYNTGEAVIGSGSVTLSLFDESGKRLVEQSGYLPVDWLEPGQFTVVNIWVAEVPEYARQEIKVKAEAVSPYLGKPLQLTITEQSVRANGLTSQMVGTVKNPHKVKVQFIKIVIYGYDDKGAPSTVDYTYATEKELAPGAESGFSAHLGGITVGKPARYVVQAYARPK